MNVGGNVVKQFTAESLKTRHALDCDSKVLRGSWPGQTPEKRIEERRRQ